jgi:multidrug resistance protein
MLAPLEHQISRDLDLTKNYQWTLVNSLILVGVGFGPLILAPVSERYGRKPALLGGSVMFLIWNTACGQSTTLNQMLAFRLLAGFGACVADSVAGGVLSDLWLPQQRGRAFALFMAAPLLGPGLGPIIGAYIAVGLSWRWAFYISSIAAAVVTVAALLFYKETFEPRLVYLKSRDSSTESTAELRQEVSGDLPDVAICRPEFRELLRTDLQRPVRMLATQPIIQIIALYMALLYGTMFLFLFMYPTLWVRRYGQSVRVGSLNYISAALGFVIGVQSKSHSSTDVPLLTAIVAGHLNDRVYAALKARSSNNMGRPEFRVPMMAVGTFLVPVGLLWWGWSGETHLHWIMPNIGCSIFTAGVYICSSCVSVYVIDAYTKYAASAVSTNLVLRSCFAAFFPIFAPYMFDKLGFGWSATILAGCFLFVGILTMLVLWFWGEGIRKQSRYCAANDVEYL